MTEQLHCGLKEDGCFREQHCNCECTICVEDKPSINIKGFYRKPLSYRVVAYARELLRLDREFKDFKYKVENSGCAACSSTTKVSNRATRSRRYGSFTVKLCAACYKAIRSNGD